VKEVWQKTVHDFEITKKAITEKSVIHARNQLGFGPKPKDSQPELDLEEQWKLTEELLCHQRELWSPDYLPKICARVIELMRRWAAGKKQQLDEGADAASVASEAASPDAPKLSKATGPSNSRAFRFWKRLNWRLHNRDLAAIWGLNSVTVRQMRYRKKYGPAQNGDPELYAREMEFEKAKAKESAHAGT
jgi:hypothetical protein